MNRIKPYWLIAFMLFFLCGMTMELVAEPAVLSIQTVESQHIQKPVPQARSNQPQKEILDNIDYFHLAIDKPSSINASVDYQTRDGTAKAGIDYVVKSGTTTILAGETSIDIGVNILKAGTGKTFSLVLTNPTGAKFPNGLSEITTTHTIGTVTDNPEPLIKNSATLKKTGQTVAYAKYDDGYYEKGVIPNYTQEQESNDILDRMTGLVWQNNTHTAGDNQFSWNEAKSYCEQLIGGWRLPTRAELSGLVRYDKYNPSIDKIFDHTVSDYYWTGDISQREASKVWVVNFSEGLESNIDKTNRYAVRCLKKRDSLVANAGTDQIVKEKQTVTLIGSYSPNKEDIVTYEWSENGKVLGNKEQLSLTTLYDGIHQITLTVQDNKGRVDSDKVTVTIISSRNVLKRTSQNISYAKYDDGYYEKGIPLNYTKEGDDILDRATGLMWQDSNATNSDQKLWQAAKDYCASLNGNWRLPTRKELSNLVSYNHYNPSIDTIFSYTAEDYYWTISSSNRDNNNAWAINFSEGLESANSKDNTYYTRCVHSGSIPIANAGIDQFIEEGQSPIILDAIQSPRDELINTYTWFEGDIELGQGERLELNNMIDGEHIITLVITDKKGYESRDNLIITLVSSQYNQVLKRTSQNISYAKYDDGYYEKGIPLNYTKEGDDILDRATGLIWQDSNATNSDQKLWQAAKDYCASFNGNWRLPTRKELSNLVSYNHYNPSIDTIFSYTAEDYYWTVDTSNRDKDQAWAISFSEGLENTNPKNSSYYARCVQNDFIPRANAGVEQLIEKGQPILLSASHSPRKHLIDSYIWETSDGGLLGDQENISLSHFLSGRKHIILTIMNGDRTDKDDLWITIVSNSRVLKKTAQTKSYADYDDGYYQKGVDINYSDQGNVIIDNTTGFEWKDNDDTNNLNMNWQKANDYCSQYGDTWRLPTRRELSGLIDYSQYNPSINNSFNNTASDYYWTVDTSNRDKDQAWAISFSEGLESTVTKDSNYYARCINAN